MADEPDIGAVLLQTAPTEAIERHGAPASGPHLMPEPSFFRYFMSKFNGDTRKFFGPWQWELMEAEQTLWDVTSRHQCVYLVFNPDPKSRLHTFVESTPDVLERLLQHEGKLEGCPSATRAAVGHWHMGFIAVIPPIASMTPEKYVRSMEGKGSSRRMAGGVEMAIADNIPWKISIETLNYRKPTFMSDVVCVLEKANMLNTASLFNVHILEAKVAVADLDEMIRYLRANPQQWKHKGKPRRRKPQTRVGETSVPRNPRIVRKCDTQPKAGKAAVLRKKTRVVHNKK